MMYSRGCFESKSALVLHKAPLDKNNGNQIPSPFLDLIALQQIQRESEVVWRQPLNSRRKHSYAFTIIFSSSTYMVFKQQFY